MASNKGPSYNTLDTDSLPTTLNDADRPESEVRETDVEATEATPLFSQPSASQGGNATTRRSSAASLLRSIQVDTKPRRRWPSIVALVLLCVVVIVIMVLGFFAPQGIKEYSEEAATFKPTSLSIAEFTSTGVKARVQGDFKMDSTRVKKPFIRGFGRIGTWVASKAETGEASVDVLLPEFGNKILGSAQIPPIVVNIRDGRTTHVDFVADLTPGDPDDLKSLARKWTSGRLGQIRIVGKAQVPIKSGIVSIGKQLVSHELLFDHSNVPSIPKYKIRKIQFHDIDIPGVDKAVAADAQVVLTNDYAVDIQLPSLAFEVSAPNCKSDQPPIPLAYVTSEPLQVLPKQDVKVDLLGVVHELDPAFTQTCPDKAVSPMDALIRDYIHGEDATVFVRAASKPSSKVPSWIIDIISDITVPITVPGHEFGELVKSFTLANVHFGLPNPMAPDDDPESNPTISATIEAVIALPEQMNFNLSVDKVRADANIFYKKKELGRLDLSKWQTAKSSRLPDPDTDGKAQLLLESEVRKAPIIITDDDVFSDVVEHLLFGDSQLLLEIEANVDVQVKTAIGLLTVRNVPAKGQVPVKPVGKHVGFETIRPEVGQLQILDTSADSLTISALINFTNPTEYFATLPYVDVEISKNGSTLGHGTIQHVAIKPGRNVNIPVIAVWQPLEYGGEDAHAIGVELLSQYISGYNTTITARTHAGTIPTQPKLGRALSHFAFEIPTPQLLAPTPDDPSDPSPGKPKGGMHFISDAVMHLISSTATFTLTSPLRTSTLYITYLNATALYKGDEVGHIDYDEIFAVPPRAPITTPSLPVDWNLGSVGYEAIRKAVGGKLKLATRATVGVRIGFWEERIWFTGNGIGAHVRL